MREDKKGKKMRSTCQGRLFKVDKQFWQSFLGRHLGLRSMSTENDKDFKVDIEQHWRLHFM